MSEVSREMQTDMDKMEHSAEPAAEDRTENGDKRDVTGSDRKKKRKKTSIWHGVFSTICALIAAGTLLTMFFDCMVTNTVGEVFWINPLWQDAEDFEQSNVYGQMLHRDATELARFLTVYSQLESGGGFDENKQVDVLQYVYRKSGKIPEKYSDIHLVYKLGDLIEWAQDGFCYVTEEEGDYAVPSHDDAYTEDYAAEYGDVENFATETVTGELTEEYGEGETAPEETVTRQPETVLQETFRPADGSSLYEMELPQGVTYLELAGYIQSAAVDLYENYSSYQRMAEKFTEQRNLKYMLLDEKGNVRASNLATKKKDVADLQKAFTQNDSYIVYDFAQNQIRCQGIGDYSEIATKSLFREYSYQFPEGGKLYVTVQKETSDKFGRYNTADSYAVAREGYYQLAGYGVQNLIAACIFGILAIVFLIFFILRIPRRQPQELKGFDRWFTEFAAGLAVGTEAVLFLATMLLADVMIYEPSLPAVGYLRKEECMTLLLVAAALLYTLFLVFLGSLVRRIKARTLIKGSFLCFVFGGIKRNLGRVQQFFRNRILNILNDREFGIRVALPFTGFVLFNIFVVLVGSVLGALVAIALNVVLLWFLHRENLARKDILEGIGRICDGDLTYQIDTEKLVGDNKRLAENVNQIGNAIEEAVRTSMKDERLKADLITNVSHDIKTPLTSIINYVDLLKRENIPGERAQEYLRILDEKSQRLKQLTLDLVEASKISSGNIVIEKTRLDMEELLQQAIGEYQEKLTDRQLDVIVSHVGGDDKDKEELAINADPRHMWRILDNLLGNICKYALAGTRVYMDIRQNEMQQVELVIKNISASPLNVPPEELTQRFVRGDASRSSEGSGLGLSIARNLTMAQGGSFEVILDGDLFKVLLKFPRMS